MLSISEVIKKNKEESGEPYFLLKRDGEHLKFKAIITNMSKSEKLLSSPDTVSRDLIQQVNNLLCQLNMMKISFDFTLLNESHMKFKQMFDAAYFINSRIGCISFINSVVIDKVLISKHLTKIQSLLKIDIEHMAKVEDHISEAKSLIFKQLSDLDTVEKKYHADSFEQKTAANNAISRVLSSQTSNIDDEKIVNSAFNLSSFEERLDDYIETQRRYYESLLVKIDEITKCLVSINVNSSSLVDVISSAIGSKEKSFDIIPTNSFEANLATYVRKTIKSVLPLNILMDLLNSHLELINQSNIEVENLTNDIDIQSQCYSDGLIESIQPFVKKDLVKVSAESMLNTQRKYEYNCEN